MTTIRRFLAIAVWAGAMGFLTACSGGGGGVNILPEPFTRERADGKIPVKRELIREQVQRELAGMPESEAEVARWQQIETDYNNCRLASGKAKAAKEQVFAKCMSDLGYVYMTRFAAEQLHNDIEFEIDKAHRARIAAERKAEEERIAAEKQRQEEAERARRQKELDDALAIILNAAKYADIAKVKRLIDDGADVNTKAKNGATALHVAAFHNQTEIANTLIKSGADVGAKTNEGLTPLHIAAVNDGAEIADVLIKARADIEAKTNHGLTPLHWSAKRGKAKIADVLVKAGADINAKDNNGLAPIHWAAFEDRAEIADVLIEAGAYLCGRAGTLEQTPLEITMFYNDKAETESVLREAIAKRGC